MEDTTETRMKKLQEAELNIAKEFASICNQNGLVYFMLGGTMLGAVRHKGFIPWDDDMDFAMFRNDYEKFLKIAPKELSKNMYVVDGRNEPEGHYYIARIYDKDTKVIEERIGNENRKTHVSIDIFPIDGTPNLWVLREIYIFRVLFHRAIMSMYYKESFDQKRKRNMAEKCLISFLDKLPLEKLTSGSKQKAQIDKIMRKQKVEDSKYIGNLMGACRTKEIMPAEVYGNGIMYQFENIELRGLSESDKYLMRQYGDYMEFPPEEDRQRKTHFKAIELHGEKIEEDDA